MAKQTWMNFSNAQTQKRRAEASAANDKLLQQIAESGSPSRLKGGESNTVFKGNIGDDIGNALGGLMGGIGNILMPKQPYNEPPVVSPRLPDVALKGNRMSLDSINLTRETLGYEPYTAEQWAKMGQSGTTAAPVVNTGGNNNGGGGNTEPRIDVVGPFQDAIRGYSNGVNIGIPEGIKIAISLLAKAAEYNFDPSITSIMSQQLTTVMSNQLSSSGGMTAGESANLAMRQAELAQAKQIEKLRLQESTASVEAQLQQAVIGQMSQLAPYGMPSGQQYSPGYEPGGVMSRLASARGQTFTPRTLQGIPLNFDERIAAAKAAYAPLTQALAGW
jgi:hypothetical protein